MTPPGNIATTFEETPRANQQAMSNGGSPLGGSTVDYHNLMNPGGTPPATAAATPSPDSSNQHYKQAVVELHNMSQNTIKMTDLKTKVRNRAKNVIYRRMKFLRQDHPAFATVKEYLRNELGMNTIEFGHHWSAILTTAKDCLRQERGAAVQLMKKDFLSEFPSHCVDADADFTKPFFVLSFQTK